MGFYDYIGYLFPADNLKKYHSIHAKGGTIKDLESAVNSRYGFSPLAIDKLTK